MTIDFSDYEDDSYATKVYEKLGWGGIEVLEAVLTGRTVLDEEYHPWLVRVLESLSN